MLKLGRYQPQKIQSSHLKVCLEKVSAIFIRYGKLPTYPSPKPTLTLTSNHSDNHVRLIPIEKLKNGRDSFRKACEAHLIHKAKTIEPLGINKRDELSLYIVYLLFFVILSF